MNIEKQYLQSFKISLSYYLLIIKGKEVPPQWGGGETTWWTTAKLNVCQRNKTKTDKLALYAS